MQEMNQSDWTIILGILIVGVPLIIVGFVAMWREHKMKKIDK